MAKKETTHVFGDMQIKSFPVEGGVRLQIDCLNDDDQPESFGISLHRNAATALAQAVLRSITLMDDDTKIAETDG